MGSAVHKLDKSRAPEINPLPLTHPCFEKVELRQEPAATARLVLLVAECGALYPKVEIAIENTGSKQIRGYSVGIMQDYEYKRGVESSHGVVSNGGVVLAVGELAAATFAGGFTNGLSYGKPTGAYEQSTLWIKRLDYTDGTSWISKLHRCCAGSNQIPIEPTQLCAGP